MKFTVNNVDYEAIEKNGTFSGYFYKTENGKKTRISRAVFEAAETEHIDAQAKVYEDEEIHGSFGYGIDEMDKAFEQENNGTEIVGLGDEEHEGLHMDLTAEEEAKAMEEAEKWLKDHGATLLGSKSSKPRKPRKSKDVAYEAEGVTLTAKQVDFMKHLPDTCFWENGLDSEVWVDCLCDDIGGQFEGKPMTVGAMISTLCEKGIGTRGVSKVNGHKATAFKLTEIGKVIAAQLGIE